MKHFASVIIIVALGATIISGCSSATNNSEISTTTGTNIADTVAETTNVESAIETTESTTKLERVEDFEIKILGTLYQLETSDTPTVSSVSLMEYGDHSDINYLDFSVYGIRCIFNKGSILYAKMKCSEKTDEMYVKLYTHHEYASYYRELNVSIDEVEEITSKAKIQDDGHLSALVMGTETTGYCDIVFIKGKKPVAVVMVKMFDEDGIEKSGKEPRQLMRDEIAKTKNETNETIPETTAKKQTKKKKKK